MAWLRASLESKYLSKLQENSRLSHYLMIKCFIRRGWGRFLLLNSLLLFPFISTRDCKFSRDMHANAWASKCSILFSLFRLRRGIDRDFFNFPRYVKVKIYSKNLQVFFFFSKNFSCYIYPIKKYNITKKATNHWKYIHSILVESKSKF